MDQTLSMNGDREQLGTALGLSAGVNLSLFLAIAWFMAVHRGFFPPPAPDPDAKDPAPEPEVEEIQLTLSPEPEPAPEMEKKAEPEPPPSKPERQFVNAVPGQKAQNPDRKDPLFFSSRNMRAASELEASPDGKEGMVTNNATSDRPVLDLRDTDFQDGKDEASAPPSQPSAPMTLPPPELAGNQPPRKNTGPRSAPGPTPPIPASASQEPDPPEPLNDQPPEPRRPDRKTDLAKNEVSPPPEKMEPVPAEEGTQEPPAVKPPEALPLAFQDNSSPNVIRIPEASKPPPPASRPKPRPEQAPALTRIPDRVPDYSPGLKAARSLGKITNRGSASLDADETVEGRYGKSVRSAIEKSWHTKMASLAGFTNPGLVEVEFEIDAKGRISGVKLMNPGEANPIMQDCALTAIINAKLPPPPVELLSPLNDSMTGGRLRNTFSFLTY